MIQPKQKRFKTMKKNSLTIIYIACLISLFGCNKKAEMPDEKPIWQDIKINDLAQLSSTTSNRPKQLKTFDFDLYIMEMPSQRLGSLNKIWQNLQIKPFTFNNRRFFSNNFFSVGYGQIDIWNSIADRLRAAQCRQTLKTSILLMDGHEDRIVLGDLKRQQTIVKIRSDNSAQSVTLGPGQVVIQITAKNIDGKRGVCNMAITPAFYSPVANMIPALKKIEKAKRIFFDTAGFDVDMGPGDFIIFGPKKSVAATATLAGLMFSSGKSETTKIYMIICTNVPN